MECDRTAIYAFLKKYHADYQKNPQQYYLKLNGNLFTGLEAYNDGYNLILWKYEPDYKAKVNYTKFRACTLNDYFNVATRYLIKNDLDKQK